MYAEEIPLRVEDASFFEDFSNNGDSGIDGVGDDENKCPRGCGGDTDGQIMDDAGIDLQTVRSVVRIMAESTHLEQIITSCR
jgi:hypothetical protein